MQVLFFLCCRRDALQFFLLMGIFRPQPYFIGSQTVLQRAHAFHSTHAHVGLGGSGE